MPLRTTRLICLCLEPPGPVRRELALFRRRLFAATGEPSALAFPDFLFLGRLPLPSPGTSSGEEGLALRKTLPALRSALPGLWKAAEGSFSSGSLSAEAGILSLGLEGPVAAILGSAPELAALPFPFFPNRGFFLLRAGKTIATSEGEGRAGEAAKSEFLLAAAREASLPGFSFFSARLLLLELQCGADPFRAQAWRELAGSRRLSGPPRAKPEQDRGAL